MSAMFWLVLMILASGDARGWGVNGVAISTVPQPYTIEECRAAGEAWKASVVVKSGSALYRCIPTQATP